MKEFGSPPGPVCCRWLRCEGPILCRRSLPTLRGSPFADVPYTLNS